MAEVDVLEAPATVSLQRRLWTGSMLVSTANLASRAGSFLGNVIAIRLLGPERIGQLGVIESWVSAVIVVALIGMSWSASRQVARSLETDAREAGEYTGAAVTVACALAGLVSVGTFVFLWFFAGDSTDPTLQTMRIYAIAVTVLLFVSTVRQIIAALAYGLQVYRALLLASVIIGFLFPPLSWLLVTLFGLTGALVLRVLILVVESAVLAYAGANELRKRAARPSLARFGRRARELLSFGFPIAVGEIVTNPVQPFMLSVLARQVTGLTQVGLVTAASRLSSISSFVPGSLAYTVTPLLAREWGRGDNRERFAAGAFLTIRAFWFTTLPIVTFFVAASPFLMRLLLGDEYSGAWPVASVALMTTLLVALNQTADRALVSAGRVWLSTSNNLVLIVASLVLGFALIPGLLALGFSLAVFFAFLAYMLWQFQWLKRLWNIPVDTLFPEAIVSAVVLGAAVIVAARLGDFAQIGVSVLLTLVVLAIEFKFFLRASERASIGRYVVRTISRRFP